MAGTTEGSPSALADGTAVTIDDGSGEIRVVIGPLALAGLDLPSGTGVSVVGPLGQRDSSGTGVEGYRLHATEPGDLTVASPPPSPTPPPSPAPSPSPGPSTPPSPSPGPSGTASPPPPTQPIPISEARVASIGNRVTVEGVVTAESGRLGTPALVAIQDASAASSSRSPRVRHGRPAAPA